ncbi:MAG: hypothetical protein EOO03_01360 [Chitinophagaceae bacterium]|nr:MAG: hypothetical protein EOO03_01360 [Chitinophagaceae bacterium]
MSLLKRIYKSNYGFFLLFLLYPIVVLPLSFLMNERDLKNLKQNGVKTEATVMEVGLSREKYNVTYSCRVRYQGRDSIMESRGGIFGDPWQHEGKTFAALYVEKDNLLRLMLNKKDSLEFNVLK